MKPITEKTERALIGRLDDLRLAAAASADELSDAYARGYRCGLSDCLGTSAQRAMWLTWAKPSHKNAKEHAIGRGFRDGRQLRPIAA